MAQARHDQVPFVPIPTTTVVVLTLTPEEASALRSLVSQVRGNHSSPTRRATAGIGKALDQLGYQYDGGLFHNIIEVNESRVPYPPSNTQEKTP